MRAVVILLVAMTVIAAGSAEVLGQAREWPPEMSLGGFQISGIRGASSPDGSGSASGTVQIPGVGGKQISLSRNSRGDVSGTVQISFRVAGYELQGSFNLDGSGMRGRGSVRTPGRPVSDVSFNVEPNGQFNGSGRMDVGSNMPVKLTMSGNSVNMTGSAPFKTQSDTPLATYSFSGDLKLDFTTSRAAMTARGTAQRNGKLSDQVTVCNVSNVEVNPSDGTGRANIDGVNVVFDFFRR